MNRSLNVNRRLRLPRMEDGYESPERNRDPRSESSDDDESEISEIQEVDEVKVEDCRFT